MKISLTETKQSGIKKEYLTKWIALVYAKFAKTKAIKLPFHKPD